MSRKPRRVLVLGGGFVAVGACHSMRRVGEIESIDLDAHRLR